MKWKNFPWRLFARISFVQILLVLIALTTSGIAGRYFFKKSFLLQVENQLHTTLGSLAHALPDEPYQNWCTTFANTQSLRLTLVAKTGVVLCDSHHDSLAMENHAFRPEIVDALQSGFGKSIRFSSTVSENMIYGALFLTQKNLILRGAIPLATLTHMLQLFDSSLVLFLTFLCTILIVLSLWSGKALANPIGHLLIKAKNVTSRQVENDESREESYGELSELEMSLNHIRRDLETKAEKLKQERDEQATLMGAISDAILAVNVDGAPLFYNSRFTLLLEKGDLKKDNESPKSFRLWEIFRNPEILNAYRMAHHEYKQSSIETVELEQGTEKRFFSVSVSPLTRSNGKVYGAVGVFHDVTELKRAEQIRIEFVANVSHELRSPLTAIKGFTDTLASDIEKGIPIEKKITDVISRNTTRLMNLINDLLDLSSLESHTEQFQKCKLKTEELTHRVIKSMEELFKNKNQTLSTHFNTPFVFAEPSRIEQVLVNLLDNAFKYTPACGKIDLSWEKDCDENVLLIVKDTGPGISTVHQTRLFERFYRIDQARSRELGGTGLGLSIVKHILQRHGGTVWVESTPGQGSTFTCRFPKV